MGGIAYLMEFRQLSKSDIAQGYRTLHKLFSTTTGIGQNEFTAGDLLNQALEDQLVIFGGFKEGILVFAGALTLYTAPRKRWLHVTSYAGEAHLFWQFFDQVVAWGREHGASEIRGFGTEATMRLARRRGFKEIYRVYSLEI